MPVSMIGAIALAFLATVAVGSVIAFRRTSLGRAQEASYTQLKALPPIAHDFTTPEGAILSLEDAYRRRDIEAPRRERRT